jgi:two-component system, LytTR family, sensor kinase
MAMTILAPHERAWVTWALIPGAWLVYALVMTTQTYFAYMREGYSVPFWGGAVLPSFIYSLYWIALTPLVLYLARRFPLDPARRRRNLTVHVFASLGIALFQRIGYEGTVMALNATDKWPFSWGRLFQLTIGFFDYGLLVYWLILLMYQALEYTRVIKEEEVRASTLKTQLAEAQLQTLKTQLQPHFLFNTLHSISELIHEDIEAADTMIARLGDFLRLTLQNSGQQMVTLQKDLESMRCYFEIERTRFQEALTMQMEIEPQTLDALVPSFLWQPIVENSIRHGIATSNRPGRIIVRARLREGTLQLEVEDNGRGLAEGGVIPRYKEGVGLANTRAILQHIYGSAHRLELANASGGGVVVMLEIPFKTMPNDGNGHEGSDTGGNR